MKDQEQGKMIRADAIEQAANRIMSKAAIDIPEDYLSGIRAMIDTEKGDLSAFVLEAIDRKSVV